MQAQARQEAGLKAGEGWFDVCSQGSRAAGAHSSPTQRHSEYSACLGEAMYSATAQALSFLCAVAPQASILTLNKSHLILWEHLSRLCAACYRAHKIATSDHHELLA